eukprot:CAMPEP_0115335422 /NCGR_PEP_ID=MMETSP0270-20121206/88450_1 /TAXON_ID=71861 /ORGANISM="Scrippsiella trochoidea, Strain CCMP3099" /LENGTH=32 /DNA_ID= /DNA_START= /DNA_END= /DNA_ORIENTATION=
MSDGVRMHQQCPQAPRTKTQRSLGCEARGVVV